VNIDITGSLRMIRIQTTYINPQLLPWSCCQR